jgi:sulfide:quinone oxidoreductase
VDRATLATQVAGVWAVGDVTQITLTNGMPLPKAGVIAELEGRVVAGEIAAELADTDGAAPFEGRAWCFIEMGLATATRFDADFFAEPTPSIQFQDISEEHAVEKHSFEEDHLRAWFGA